MTSARNAIAENPGDDATAAELRSAFKALDKAASKGVVHRRNAARRKSRLARNLNKALAAE